MRFYIQVRSDGKALQINLMDSANIPRKDVANLDELSNYVLDACMKFGADPDRSSFMISSSINWPDDYNATEDVKKLCEIFW